VTARDEQSDIERIVAERTAKLEEANRNLDILNKQLIERDHEREQAQIALRESEERFRTIFDNNHAVMLIINPTTGLIVDANAAAILYYGYTAKALLKKTVTEINILTPEQINEEMNRAKKAKRDHFIFKHKLANGDIRDVEVFSGPVKIHDKQLLYSIIHDITDRCLAEEALQRCERVIASSPNLISLIDHTYHYRMVNDAYLKMFNKNREDIEGKHIPDLIGKDFFNETVKPDLDKAFSGETVRRENMLDVQDKGPRHLSVTYHPVAGLDNSIDYVSVVVRDITERKQNERAIKRFADRLALATEAGNIGIWEWDIETGDLLWDDMMMEIYKIPPSELAGTYEDWKSRVHPDDIDEAEKSLTEAMERNKPFEYDFRIIWPDGQIRHIKAAALIRFKGDKIKSLTGINWDETTTRQLEKELRRLATTDPLTGAHNRRHFTERATAEISRGRRYASPVSMLTIDIDHFKDVNDTYGHPAGDEVLKVLVRVCKETLRISDIFARMGGEEFSAILPETDAQAALQSAERLREAVAKTKVVIDDKIISYTISIGLSQILGPKDSLEELMRRADTALYRAKDLGRNRVESA